MSHYQPTVIVDSGASYQFKDVEFPGFNFRFVKQGNMWVCTMDEWLVDQAIIVATAVEQSTEAFKYLETQVYGGTTK